MTIEQAHEKMILVGNQIIEKNKNSNINTEAEDEKILKDLHNEVKEFYPDFLEFFISLNEVILRDKRNRFGVA